MDYQEYVKYEWSLARRAYAALCDYFCYLILCAIFFMIFSEPLGNGMRMLPPDYFLVFPLIWFIWFPVTESFRGRTFFKFVFKLRVIFEGQGKKDRFASTLLRRLADPLDFFFSFGIIAIFTAKLSRNHKRLGDMWGATHVVWERNQQSGEHESPASLPK